MDLDQFKEYLQNQEGLFKVVLSTLTQEEREHLKDQEAFEKHLKAKVIKEIKPFLGVYETPQQKFLSENEDNPAVAYFFRILLKKVQ